MAILKGIQTEDKKTTKSYLNQLVDILQEDISGSSSRRKYQSFVTGGVGPGVTSSLFQTVYDQSFVYQTANPLFDVTFGIASPVSLKNNGTANSDGIAADASSGQDSNGKYLYPSSTLMMREKTDVYGQFAQTLLGDRKAMFKLPVDASNPTQNTDVDAALFVSFKRLFSRDGIKRETFAMRFFKSASFVATTGVQDEPPTDSSYGVPNLYVTSTTGSSIFTDVGSSNNRFVETGGQYGYIVDAASTTNAVGLIFYDSGVVMLDVEKVTSGSQYMSGTISAMHPLGETVLGGVGTETANKSKMVPDFVVSGSLDDVIDHFCYARMGSSSETGIAFQNMTNINSTLVFCNLSPDDFNYSSNPTYVEPVGSDYEGRLVIYDPALPEESQEPFSYITTVGLHDAQGGLLGVAKLSRPVEKNPGRNLTIRVRLDFLCKKSLKTT